MMKEKLEQFDEACARAEELVTYLYGEAGEEEAAEFRRHLQGCAVCAQEMAAFSRVREDVVEWRNLSLPSFEFSQAVAPAALEQAAAAGQRRSALAALRQFFTLAPAWMRAATAMAALLICALVVFTALYFSEQSGAGLQQIATGDGKESRPDLTVKSNEELRKQEPQQVKETQATMAAEDGSVEAVDNRATAPPAKSRRQAALPVVARRNRATPDKVKASQAAREQLAELVQAAKDEDGLPRLSDLIEDGSGSN